MSRPIRTTLATVALTLVTAILGVTTAGAAPAEHNTFTEAYSRTETVPADENPCGSWAASMTETRSGKYQIVQAPGGQSEGEFHVNGAVEGFVELAPVDAALPTYTGRYREKVNAVITGYDEGQGDLARVAQFRLRTPLTGTDGSSLVLAMSGKLTMTAAGDAVVENFSVTCS